VGTRGGAKTSPTFTRLPVAAFASCFQLETVKFRICGSFLEELKKNTFKKIKVVVKINLTYATGL
jgi:hypothetical protein